MSVQVSTRIDKATKTAFDHVCERIGTTPSNALSMFIKSVINHNGIPFMLQFPHEKTPSADMLEAMEDVRLRRNLHGPYDTVDDAMRALLED
ncbi:MAG: type II toxin-antitoxin system RelB/DinJ family antitoxin [Defluviitaleaceae bacterium]|nr:type II toxin-antitoxin system RelB/DinJ family antitoxin [Defluviitaleaceae bacterium]